MPKKTTHGVSEKEGKGQSSARPSSPVFKEGSDPIETVVSVLEKKARNLSKRKDRLSALQQEKVGGKGLDKDQLEAISKLPDVLVQIEFLHEMQKQFSDLNLEYQRFRKTKLKMEEKMKKDEDKHIQRASLSFCLKIQTMLEQLDDTTKEAFRSGTDGAVKLTENELKQLDDFYDLVNPKRPGNSKFESDLSLAVNHILLLKEGSSDTVVGTTYKSLADVFKRMDRCGYLDKEPPVEEELDEEEEEEEEEEDEDDEVGYEDQNVPSLNEFTSLEEVPSTDDMLNGPTDSYSREDTLQEQVRQVTPTLPKIMGQAFNDAHSEDLRGQSGSRQSGSRQSGSIPPISAPSPDFSGLGSNTIPPTMDFQFMRGDPQSPPAAVSTQSPFGQPTFPSTFKTIERNSPIERVPSSQDRPLLDNQYVPETGQQMNEKSEVVGNPIIIGGGEKQSENTNSKQPSTVTSNGTSSYKGNNGRYTSYDKRNPRNNGNNRQKPYGKRDGGNYGGSSNNYGGGSNNYGGGSNNYGGGSNNYGGGPKNYGGSNGYNSNRGMGNGRQQSRSGGRGRPNYNYNNPQQHPNNRSGNTGPRNNTRPQQQSYASTTASAQS